MRPLTLHPRWFAELISPIGSCYNVNSFHINHVVNIPVSECFIVNATICNWGYIVNGIYTVWYRKFTFAHFKFTYLFLDIGHGSPNAFYHIFLAATKQLYKWYFPSVRLSVCLSVTPFWLCSHHRIIMKFSEVITNGQSKVHAKGQGQRSKVKVTEVTTQLNRFRTVTPVWIHIWWWNDAYSLMLLRRGALLFFKVIRQIARSHGSKNRRIWPRLGVSGL